MIKKFIQRGSESQISSDVPTQAIKRFYSKTIIGKGNNDGSLSSSMKRQELIQKLRQFKRNRINKEKTQDLVAADTVYDTILMEDIPINDFLKKEDNVIIKIDDDAKIYGFSLRAYKIFYECVTDLAYQNYINHYAKLRKGLLNLQGEINIYFRLEEIAPLLINEHNNYFEIETSENVKIISYEALKKWDFQSMLHDQFHVSWKALCDS